MSNSVNLFPLEEWGRLRGEASRGDRACVGPRGDPGSAGICPSETLESAGLSARPKPRPCVVPRFEAVRVRTAQSSGRRRAGSPVAAEVPVGAWGPRCGRAQLRCKEAAPLEAGGPWRTQGQARDQGCAHGRGCRLRRPGGLKIVEDVGGVYQLGRRCRLGPGGPAEDALCWAAKWRNSRTRARPQEGLGTERGHERESGSAERLRGSGVTRRQTAGLLDLRWVSGPWHTPKKRSERGITGPGEPPQTLAS
ncbi:hypothetical protein NDU88_007912 [Pleurodeles waltl]|uniref:Uncharacterized protein n=1 Tax=Pleurodeles waltl TaxID=8319 RepID=A0AAV7STV8_PLEWA|nr:hypothetical protein NDU88_007912 [Pleurodeles waltl]